MSRLDVCLIFSFIWVPLLSGQENNCTCVVFYFCNNDTMKPNETPVVDISATKGKCTYLETCCQEKDIVSQATLRQPEFAKQPSCGKRNLDGVGHRIAGNADNEAEFGEFPWTVAILHKHRDETAYSFKCGGSLLHPQVVLTAAHCVLGGTNFRIRAGEWDTQTTQERLKHQERKATSAVVHKAYRKINLQNDIALLFLDSPVNLTAHINVVCLPPANSVAVSDECFVSGWGKDKFEKSGAYQSILKKILVPIVNREQCQNDFRKTRLGNEFYLHDTFICAGGNKDEDACTGDGGGPLVCPVEGQEDTYQQVGIVSWGIGCGNEGVPGAYVDVARSRNWIDEQMKKRKFI